MYQFSTWFADRIPFCLRQGKHIQKKEKKKKDGERARAAEDRPNYKLVNSFHKNLKLFTSMKSTRTQVTGVS